MNKIADNIFWTGYIDWSLRNFHGYSTPSGSTYNAYLILDEKPTLIDTVKHYGFDEMLSRIKSIIDPSKIRYIISNHTEMDHSGCIDRLLKYCPQAEVVCSPKGAEGLQRYFKKDWKFKVVKTGDSLNIGRRTLKFVQMPMVHWPDSMATYSEDDAILFPNDAFGQHIASSERYADEVGLDIVAAEAAKYYANIVLPYGSQVQKALKDLHDLKINMICPSHGLIWRQKENIERIISLYRKWSLHETDARVSIIYGTMWQSTECIAQKLYELIDRENIPVKMINLRLTEMSDAITDIMHSRVVLFGSAILNNRILPSVGGFLTYMKGLKPKNRYGVTFGSYGWATIGFKDLEQGVKESGIELLEEGRYFRFMPDESDLNSLKDIVDTIKTKL